MSKTTSDEEFNAQLRQQFIDMQSETAKVSQSKAATQTPPKQTMILNTPPKGNSKSLSDMFAKEPKEQPVVIPEAISEEPTGDFDGAIFDADIDLIDDSPYQPRLSYDESELLALGALMQDNGQEEEILVRRKPDGRLEIISGHRRKRSARLIGWTKVRVKLGIFDDRTAQLKTLISNEGRENLSDFERALAFQMSIDQGFAKFQSDVARLFGCTQGRVSQCLTLLAMPREILDLLRKYPALFGYRMAQTINGLCKRFPDDMNTIIDGVHQLIGNNDFTAEDLEKFVTNKLSKVTRGHSTAPLSVPNTKGETVFAIRARKNQIIIDVKDRTLDKDELNQQLLNWLKSQVPNV